MITRNLTLNIDDITPQELAFIFCNNDSGYQAEFLNEIAKITDQWKAPFCFQLQAITDDESLRPEAREIMRQIGEYAEPTIR